MVTVAAIDRVPSQNAQSPKVIFENICSSCNVLSAPNIQNLSSKYALNATSALRNSKFSWGWTPKPPFTLCRKFFFYISKYIYTLYFRGKSCSSAPNSKYSRLKIKTDLMKLNDFG